MSAVSAWFAARTADELREAEDAILSLSAGAITSSSSVEVGTPRLGGEAESDALAAEAVWLAAARIDDGGVRSTSIFGPLGSEARRTAIAHVAVDGALPHPLIDARMRCIPVTPPAGRPPVHSDGVVGPPLIDALYEEIVSGLWLLDGRRLEALDGSVQDFIIEPIRALLAGAESSWRPGESPRAEHADVPPEALRFEPSAIAIDGAEVLLDNGVIAALDVESGGVRRIDARGAGLVAACEHHLVVRSLDRFFVMDRADGAWIPRPPELSVVALSEVYDGARLVRDDGATLVLQRFAGAPATLTISADLRFVWVENREGTGGVFRTRDGARIATLPQEFDAELDASLPGFDPYGDTASPCHEPLERSDDPEEHPFGGARLRSPAAVAVTPRGVLTFRNGVVSRDGIPWFVLAFPVKLAAFDIEGLRLATYASPVREPTHEMDATLRVFDLSSEPRLSLRRSLR